MTNGKFTRSQFLRHGDVQIQRIDPISLDGKTEVKRSYGGLVLRHGTNDHVIADKGARLYEPGDVDGTSLLVVDGPDPVRLSHVGPRAEHETVSIPPGTYRVGVARQGDDDSWSDVID